MTQKKFTVSSEQKQNIKTLIADMQNSVEGTPSESSVTQLKANVKAALSDRKLTKSEFKTIANDVLNVANSAGVTAEEARTLLYDLQDIAEASRFPKTNDDLTGTTGNDVLWGGLGSDRLNAAGADDAGKDEVDLLCGGSGKDTFVLGDAATGFYDDGNNGSLGLQDYATLLDFNKKQDKIQLHGNATDYTLGALPSELAVTGTGIYQTTRTVQELVGVVVGVNLTDLNTGFTFV